MVRCSTVLVVITAVIAAGLAYVFFQPLPEVLADPWSIRVFGFRFFLAFMKAELLGLIGFNKMAQIRSGSRGLMLSFGSGNDYSDTIKITDEMIEGVPVRIYRPKSLDESKPGPVFIWYHGGGWVMGDVEEYDDTCKYIARERQIVVISVEYRLGPEHPFPAGFDDCLAVTKHVLQNGHKLKVDPKRVAIGGDSAGGQIAASMSIILRDQGVKPPISAQLLIYGSLQLCDMALPIWKIRYAFEGSKTGHATFSFFLGSWLGLTDKQTKMVANDTYLTPELQNLCRKYVDYKLMPASMIPDGYEPDDQTARPVDEDAKIISEKISDLRVSPLLSPSLRNLPATYILSTHWDFVRDDSPIFAKRLEQDGGNVKWLHLADGFHGCLTAFAHTKCGKEATDGIIEYLKDNM